MYVACSWQLNGKKEGSSDKLQSGLVFSLERRICCHLLKCISVLMTRKFITKEKVIFVLLKYFWKYICTLLYIFWSQERIQRVMDIVKFIFWLCSTYSKNFYDVRNLNYLKLNTYGWQRNYEKRFEDIRILQRMRINHRQCWRSNINKCFSKIAQTNPVPPWYKHSSYLERGESVVCSE
jgi:hypothetical protein